MLSPALSGDDGVLSMEDLRSRSIFPHYVPCYTTAYKFDNMYSRPFAGAGQLSLSSKVPRPNLQDGRFSLPTHKLPTFFPIYTVFCLYPHRLNMT